jgi:hypothetical protein
MTDEVGPPAPSGGMGSAGVGSGATAAPPSPPKQPRPGYAGAPGGTSTARVAKSKTSQSSPTLTAQEQRTIIIAAKAVAKKREATHALDKCIATIIQKKLGSHRPPTDAEVERFDDDVLSPFRERLRKLNIDDTQVAEAVEYYRYQLAESSLRRIPEDDAIISDPQSGLKPQVRKALANARHWIGRHTSEKNLNKKDVIENEKLRLESTMLGRSAPLKTLLLEEMRKTNEDNYVPISDIDLQAISDEFFIKKPNAP